MFSTTRRSARAGVTERRRAFIQAYIANGQNATEAAITAGYSKKTAAQQGHILLRKLENSGELAVAAKASAERAELKTDEVLYQVRCGLRADPRKLFKADGSLVPIPELDAETAAALDIEIDADGKVKRRFWSKGTAAQMAMKHLGLYEKDNKHLGPNLALQVVLVSPPQRPPEDYEE